jgi:stage II sporulation protein D
VVASDARSESDAIVHAEEGGGETTSSTDPGVVRLAATGGTECFAIAASESEAEARRYRGELDLEHRDGQVFAINSLDLETYVAAVAGAEMPPLYPLEALKAQVVVSRTYALYSLWQAQARGGEAEFPAGTSFQVYGGVKAEHHRVSQAVEATRGRVLAYQGRIFRSYFHSTCGGQTSSAGIAFGDVQIPPLGGVRCNGCEGTRLWRWESIVEAAEIEAGLRRRLLESRAGVEVGKVTAVEVSDLAPDGRVLYVRVEHEKGALQWRADRFRLELERSRPGTLLSGSFTVERLDGGGRYRFRGAGWGHGVGLCQVGSGSLARGGKDCVEILEHYFPEAHVVLADDLVSAVPPVTAARAPRGE